MAQVMDEPTMDTCFPNPEVADEACRTCHSWVPGDHRYGHVDWHHQLWSALQPSAG
ncbi:hypothetical protein ACGFZR_15115 [Streptomyces sp. NPDC048241]|uniref:hypothetical protein n=1 Tax=Streptomyces sp. NPDC048241 TaxID=3365521 RepID=UPI003723141C